LTAALESRPDRHWRGLVAATLLVTTAGCGKLLQFPDSNEPWNEAVGDVTGVAVNRITLAEQDRLLLEHIDEGLRDPLRSPYFLIGVLGCFLWTIAYVLLIKQAHQQRVNTLPMLAICLNFTWEVMAVFVLPNPSKAWTVLEWSWVVIDLGLLALLWRDGRQSLRVSALRPYFHLLLPVVLVLCFVGQLTFVLTFGDLLGFIDAFIINLVMSALFISMFFDRQDSGVGLNYGAAWLKMIGTACTSIQCAALLPVIRPDVPSWGFLYFLYLLIFALDVVYVVLLHNARRSALSNVTKAP
jgi:hypothetical protein